ncbi:MAG: NAD(P)/FAD-dependent oxidoreductase [Dehalococcoidia bacterium]|nr:NAD(P)/FAD-dependent oxidoreductase [Dehalococcoidia bacterium]
MAHYDVLIIGGGPAGYTAAIAAAGRGAKVALVEAERPGGACVHYACIPTNIMAGAAASFLDARELAVHGVLETGERFSLPRAAARKDALVAQMAKGIAAALRISKVEVIQGRATFSGRSAVAITEAGGQRDVTADAFVIATGTRWDPPSVPGAAPDRVLTADAVQALHSPPSSAVVLAAGPAGSGFSLEYAFLLATAGSSVTIVTDQPRILPALDTSVATTVRGMLEGAGIQVFTGATIRAKGSNAVITADGRSDTVPAEVFVAADVRRPYFETLNPGAAAVEASADGIAVDSSCRTSNPAVFAAGDVTGQVMLSSAATHMGEVAGLNAAGGTARTRLAHIPHVLQMFPEVAWIGLTEEQAVAGHRDVVTGVFDLAYNARAIALGAREGIVKVVAERELGEVLGVHVAGPGAAEIANIAAAVMQAEVSLHDLAAMTFWHPSMGESLAEAARRALARF